jgi:phosphoribosylanthranilate isomerase
MFKPYIGITGFTQPKEVTAALQVLPPGRRRLMVGILVSDRTLEGLPEEMGPRRHPAVADLENLFSADPRAFNAVHFHTRTPERLVDQVERVIAAAGPRLHALQINLDQIPLDALRVIRARCPSLQLILPLRETAGRFAEAYVGLVDIVLFDWSAGRGVLFDPAEARAVLEEVEAKMPGVALAVAGGLGPDTVDLVRPLLERFPDLSFDAESRLRDADDRLDLAKVGEYLKALP